MIGVCSVFQIALRLISFKAHGETVLIANCHSPTFFNENLFNYFFARVRNTVVGWIKRSESTKYPDKADSSLFSFLLNPPYECQQ